MKNSIFIALCFFVGSNVYAKKSEKVPEKIESAEEYKTYLEKFVNLKNSDIKACEKGLKLKGQMVMKWEVGEDGVASDFSRGKDTLDNGDVYHCLEKKIMTWKFPKPPMDRPIELEYEFSFNSKK